MISRVFDRHPSAHKRVVCSAILRTEKMVFTNPGGTEPQRVIPTGHHVHLYAECWYIKIVDDIFAPHDQLDVPVHGYVQFVDFLTSIRLLQLPHPLLADYINV